VPPVLVTGATGFIGREVVRRLLAAGRPVVALARRRRNRPAADRVAAAVGLGPDGRRLDVVEADLTRPGLGLEPSAWRRLRETVELVIHGAGDTSFFPEASTSFRAGHVDGPLELLHGLTTGRLRVWAQLSTAYVCGRRSGLVLEHEGDVGQAFHNAYERVKLEAETALRGAGARLGVDVRVFRPSIVVGTAPETAGGSPANLFSGFIRLVGMLAESANGAEVPLRIVAAPQAPFNIVPVDFVTAAVVALALYPDGAGRISHLVVADAPSQQATLAMITERLGVRGLSCWMCVALVSRTPRGWRPGRAHARGLSRVSGAGRPVRRRRGAAAPGPVRAPAPPPVLPCGPSAHRPGPGDTRGSPSGGLGGDRVR